MLTITSIENFARQDNAPHDCLMPTCRIKVRGQGQKHRKMRAKKHLEEYSGCTEVILSSLVTCLGIKRTIQRS